MAQPTPEQPPKERNRYTVRNPWGGNTFYRCECCEEEFRSAHKAAWHDCPARVVTDAWDSFKPGRDVG